MIGIIVPDLHLGKGLSMGKSGIGTILNSRLVDQINILDWILSQAIENNASIIVFTGDIFEEVKPFHQIISIFISWLKNCTDYDIKVHIVAGNHDILRSANHYISALDIISSSDMEDVFFYKDIATFQISDICFTLLPFRDRRSFNTNSNEEAINLLREQLPKPNKDMINVLVGHLSVEGSIYVGDEIDDSMNELFCPLEMFNDYDYVYMGHIHKHQVMSANPYVVHLGSCDMSDFSEADQKKFIVVFNSKLDDPQKHIQIPNRPLHKVSIQVPENIKDTTSFVVDQIKALDTDFKKSMVKLDITLESEELVNVNRSIIEKELLDRGTFHISRISEQKQISSVKKKFADEIDNTINESTAIKIYAETNLEQEAQDIFIATANSIIDEYKAEIEK